MHLPLFPTGVGSTHHTDAPSAVAAVFRQYGRMPFWPQLPNRAPEELMIPQFGLALPGARWEEGRLHWSGEPSEAALQAFGLPPIERAAGLHAFLAHLEAMPPSERPPVVKGQVVGPLTLAMALREASGDDRCVSPEWLTWLGRALGRTAAAQAILFQRLGPRAVLMVDEPALANVEEPSLPVRWRDAAAALAAAFQPVQDTGALAGVHCCQSANWTRALDARPDLIHFDAREGHIEDALEHLTALRNHIGRGGYMGWGLWPTDRPAQGFDARAMQYHVGAMARQIAFIDASMGLVFKRSVVSGVCGTAGLSGEQEARMAQDLEDLSMGIRKRYWIAASVDVDPDHPLT